MLAPARMSRRVSAARRTAVRRPGEGSWAQFADGSPVILACDLD